MTYFMSRDDQAMSPPDDFGRKASPF